jgi:hypothetical protein
MNETVKRAGNFFAISGDRLVADAQRSASGK